MESIYDERKSDYTREEILEYVDKLQPFNISDQKVLQPVESMCVYLWEKIPKKELDQVDNEFRMDSELKKDHWLT